MAQSGTITAVRDSNRGLRISITGVTQSTNTPTFKSMGYPIGSFTAQGTFDTASVPTVNLQGSNDGGTTWFSVGSNITAAAPTGSMIGANNEVFQLYQFNVGGGDAGTNLSFFAYLASTFG